MSDQKSDAKAPNGLTAKYVLNGREPWSLGATLSIVAGHEAAAALTRRRSNGVQNPAIEKAKSGPYYLFAVFA